MYLFRKSFVSAVLDRSPTTCRLPHCALYFLALAKNLSLLCAARFSLRVTLLSVVICVKERSAREAVDE